MLPAKNATEIAGLKLIYQPDRTDTFYLVVESEEGFSSVDSYRLRVEQLQAETFAFEDTRVYPNPLRLAGETMTFAYQISASQIADSVDLEIFTPTGILVYKDAHQNVFSQGKFQWRGENINETPVASGIYIYRISARQAALLIQEIGKFSVVK